jgi:hypothetical protein
MFRPAKKLSPIEQSVIAGPCFYTAVGFRGYCQRERLEADSFEEAIALAPQLYGNDHRGVGIYAYNEAGRTAMLGYWEPDRAAR